MANPIDKYDDAKKEALYSILNGTELYFYRKICRYISSTYNTPLKEVEEYPVVWVLRHYYESVYDKLNKNDLIDEAIDSMCPEIKQIEEESLNSLIERLEKQSKKPPKEEEQSQSLKEDMPEDVPQNLPQFNMNFEDLE